jgi:hypothetical protein
VKKYRPIGPNRSFTVPKAEKKASPKVEDNGGEEGESGLAQKAEPQEQVYQDAQESVRL